MYPVDLHYFLGSHDFTYKDALYRDTFHAFIRYDKELDGDFRWPRLCSRGDVANAWIIVKGVSEFRATMFKIGTITKIDYIDVSVIWSVQHYVIFQL